MNSHMCKFGGGYVRKGTYAPAGRASFLRAEAARTEILRICACKEI